MLPFGVSSSDDDQLVHHAVRNGHIISLEIYLNQNPDSINKIFEYDDSKWTPLLAACFYKHESIVRMLLVRFKTEIEALGTVTMDSLDGSSQTVECVTPLWVAAAVDDFEIVKLLVEHGRANVNHLTETHSTAFRAACYNGNLQMAQYLVEHGANPYQKRKGNYTNLMLSIYHRHVHIVTYLVDELKCDVNEEDEHGQTALYCAVKNDSLEITKFLLEHGAINIRDKLRKVTPLMRAALFGEIDLVNAFEGYCSDLEWIEAKELFGATFAGCVSNIENLDRAVEYLTQAFELRAVKNLPKVISSELIELFDFRRECETLEQFNQLLSGASTDALVIEAILIHERLLGTASHDYLGPLHHRGTVLANAGQFCRCLQFWLYELDLRRQHGIDIEKEDLREFVPIFDQILSIERATVPLDALVQVLTIVNDKVDLNDPDNHDYNLYTLLFLITISARVLYEQSAVKNQEISVDHRQTLLRLIRSINKCYYTTSESKSSLLHLCLDQCTTLRRPAMRYEVVCSFAFEYNELSCSYPCFMTTRLLISCGANVDAMDSKRNTPLHIFVRSYQTADTLPFIDLLCDVSGAHLDCVNVRGETPLESVVPWKTTRVIQQLRQKMDVRPLKCLCARLIRQKELSYNKHLSMSLVNFVEKH